MSRRGIALPSKQAPPNDPLAFAQRCGLTPDPWQAKLLTTHRNQVLLNCCRQSGKSTITAVAALRRAMVVPNSLILMLAPGERQSKQLFSKLKQAYHALEYREATMLNTEIEH